MVSPKPVQTGNTNETIIEVLNLREGGYGGEELEGEGEDGNDAKLMHSCIKLPKELV